MIFHVVGDQILGVEPQLSEITAKAYRAKVGPTT